MKLNRDAEDARIDRTVRLAGGYGMNPAVQSPEEQLRRSVLTCLLWEDAYYKSGSEIAKTIKELAKQVSPEFLAQLIIEARTKQKLRHVPLYLTVLMSEMGGDYRQLVSKTLYNVINRADELAETLAIYWKDGRKPLGKQIKTGLANAFSKFNEYQFAKYNRDSQIKLRDVMFLVHPKPSNEAETELFKKIADDTLAVPDTWEVALSTGKDKKETFERLILEHKLGALAFLRNLRAMENAGVSREIIKHGFETINPKWLLPINYYSAYKASPRWVAEIEKLMLAGYSNAQKLPGKTILVIDVSGSMGSPISNKSSLTREEVASAMAMMVREVCEDVQIYITAGNDLTEVHSTALIPAHRGFGLIDAIKDRERFVGGGGIFTRQCLEYIKRQENTADRIIIFSDSQDCDTHSKKLPEPFGKTNYIVDVSSYEHGVNYKGVWTAEISGWSEYFIPYIFALEGYQVLVDEN